MRLVEECCVHLDLPILGRMLCRGTIDKLGRAIGGYLGCGPSWTSDEYFLSGTFCRSFHRTYRSGLHLCHRHRKYSTAMRAIMPLIYLGLAMGLLDLDDLCWSVLGNHRRYGPRNVHPYLTGEKGKEDEKGNRRRAILRPSYVHIPLYFLCRDLMLIFQSKKQAPLSRIDSTPSSSNPSSCSPLNPC